MTTFWLGRRCVTASSSALFSDLFPQLHAIHFPILCCIARDILCISGVSMAVEHLFSSSKHTHWGQKPAHVVRTWSRPRIRD
ncbi:hypothetical protein B0H17DRAFT_945457 [Mycena rosella]|uniref:HAT C-terminal dimerisation domain-containing protein n=1 Tax=Mycena rosella TaxID=1033263 RepID=A0AAD7D4G8_MYCRO|nr:hypothetical protein B0H17DRAFT_945457 [Mycena rosella]